MFTGWDFDLQGQNVGTGTATPDFTKRPMIQVPKRYETGAKTFLGTTIPDGTDAAVAEAHVVELDPATGRRCDRRISGTLFQQAGSWPHGNSRARAGDRRCARG